MRNTAVKPTLIIFKMKSQVRFFLIIALISITFSSYGQVDLKKNVDAVQNGIKGVFKKKDKTSQNQQNQNNKSTTQNSDKNNAANNEKEGQEQQGLESYSKYDFIPGEKVIFFDDFIQDNVGDFPALWNTNGSAEVVTTNLFPGHWMKFDCRESIWTDELLKLPENYTIEFDIVPVKGSEGSMKGYDFRLLQSINAKAFDYGAVPGKAGFLFSCEYFGRPGYRTYFNGEGEDMDLSGTRDDEQLFEKMDQKYHLALWIQKARVRLYLDQNKIFDLPKAFSLPGLKMDRIRFEEGAAMVSNVRIAVGAPDMRNKLLTEGKLVSYGIYFDVNKDIVKPESFGTLKEIAAVLTDNPNVRIKIIGHTDSDGSAAANLDLSKRRGASVKNELVKTFGIDASRLESDGLGSTQPVAPNDTPANKALNRRVEFIKL
jgi:OmpA-OmpF porin, OOP family